MLLQFVSRLLREAERQVTWCGRHYGRYLVVGALSSCLAVNLALHAGAGLLMYCQEECIIQLLQAPPRSLDPEVIQYIRQHLVDPPAAPRGTYKPNYDLEHPPWGGTDSWGEAYKFINEYFKQYKTPGTFMELGAGDGEFRSLSLYVEQSLGFRGVLVEPDPTLYRELRRQARSSSSLQACATPSHGHRRESLWVRDTPKDLPLQLYRIQRGNNRLMEFVSAEDRDLGKTVPVQCLNAGAIAAAALGTRHLDLLIISTHGGEADIFTTLPLAIKAKMVVLVMSVAVSEEWEAVKAAAEERNMIVVQHYNGYHILAPKSLIMVVLVVSVAISDGWRVEREAAEARGMVVVRQFYGHHIIVPKSHVT